MSHSQFPEPLRSDVTLIEIDDEAVGLAVREASGFRFFTAVSALRDIDSQVFRSLKALRRAAREGQTARRRRLAPLPSQDRLAAA